MLFLPDRDLQPVRLDQRQIDGKLGSLDGQLFSAGRPRRSGAGLLAAGGDAGLHQKLHHRQAVAKRIGADGHDLKIAGAALFKDLARGGLGAGGSGRAVQQRRHLIGKDDLGGVDPGPRQRRGGRI